MKRYAILLKKIVSLCLLTTTLAALLPAQALAATPYKPQAAQAYSFYSAIEEGGADSERTLYYTEDYFSEPATEYNPSLASATLCMAMSAFGSNRIFNKDGTYDFTKANYNWKALFQDSLGFRNVQTNAYFTKPTRTDNVGVAMAWNQITVNDGSGFAKTIPLVVVGVRGANYMSEWGGNVNVGLSGDHAGFQQAAYIVLDELNAYIDSVPELKGQSIKLWISGFSRAAATSNLAAGYLDEAIANGSVAARLGASLAKEDLYCYTFETPAGTVTPYTVAHGVDYSNIFNIINPNDLVPKVAPYFNDAAFIRYGTDVNLPSSITSSEAAVYETVMKSIFAQLRSNTPYIVDQFVNKRLELTGTYDGDVSKPQSAAEFCSRFVSDLASDAVKTRAQYSEKYEKSLAFVMDFFCGSGERFGGKANQKKFLAFFSKSVNKAWMFWVLTVHLIGEWKWRRDNFVSAFTEILQEARNSTGVQISDEYIKEVSQMATSIIWEIVGDSPMDNLREYNYYLTFSYGATNVLQAHDPDVCLAWMMSMDRNYLPVTGKYLDCNLLLNCGEYRAVTLTGVTTAKVERLSATGQVVDTKKYTAEFFGSRQLRLLLPVDSTYRVSIHSPSFGGSVSFNYLVSEYSPALNGVKRIFFYKNPLETYTSGMVYTALLPAYSNGMVTPDPVKVGLPEGSDLDYRLAYQGSYVSRVSINKLLRDIRGGSGTELTALSLVPQSTMMADVNAESVVIQAGAGGESLNYQWYRQAANSDVWSPIDGATAPTYTINHPTKNMTGDRYVCRVYDLLANYGYTGITVLSVQPPKTGDPSTPLLWALLMLAGLLCGSGAFLLRAKRRSR
ncbi:MAG: hypothetical protein PHI98_05135 [Eubacteriales bacterium]|nr:hypothetical protein [Eubacteriales bacterium]